MAISVKDKFDGVADASLQGRTPDVGLAWDDLTQTAGENAKLDGSGAAVADSAVGTIFCSATDIGNDNYHAAMRTINAGPHSKQTALVMDCGEAPGSSSGYLQPAQEETTWYSRRMSPGNNPPGGSTLTFVSPGPGDYVVFCKIYTDGSDRKVETWINGELLHTRTDSSPLPITRNIGLWFMGNAGDVKIFGMYAQSSINSVAVTHDYDGENIPLGGASSLDIIITGTDTAYWTIAPFLASHWTHDGTDGFAITAVEGEEDNEAYCKLTVTKPSTEQDVTIIDPTTLEPIVLSFGGTPPALDGGTISRTALSATSVTLAQATAASGGVAPYATTWEIQNVTAAGSYAAVSGATSAAGVTVPDLLPNTNYNGRRVTTDDELTVAYSDVENFTTPAASFSASPSSIETEQASVFVDVVGIGTEWTGATEWTVDIPGVTVVDWADGGDGVSGTLELSTVGATPGSGDLSDGTLTYSITVADASVVVPNFTFTGNESVWVRMVQGGLVWDWINEELVDPATADVADVALSVSPLGTSRLFVVTEALALPAGEWTLYAHKQTTEDGPTYDDTEIKTGRYVK